MSDDLLDIADELYGLSMASSRRPATPRPRSSRAPTWPPGQGAEEADRRGVGRQHAGPARDRAGRPGAGGQERRCGTRRSRSTARSCASDPPAPSAHEGGHHAGPRRGRAIGLKVTQAVADQVEGSLTAACSTPTAPRRCAAACSSAPVERRARRVGAGAAVALPEALGFAATSAPAPAEQRPVARPEGRAGPGRRHQEAGRGRGRARGGGGGEEAARATYGEAERRGDRAGGPVHAAPGRDRRAQAEDRRARGDGRGGRGGARRGRGGAGPRRGRRCARPSRPVSRPRPRGTGCGRSASGEARRLGCRRETVAVARDHAVDRVGQRADRGHQQHPAGPGPRSPGQDQGMADGRDECSTGRSSTSHQTEREDLVEGQADRAEVEELPGHDVHPVALGQPVGRRGAEATVAVEDQAFVHLSILSRRRPAGSQLAWHRGGSCPVHGSEQLELLDQQREPYAVTAVQGALRRPRR